MPSLSVKILQIEKVRNRGDLEAYALSFKKPIIISKGVFLGELVDNNRLEFVVDVFFDVTSILNNFLYGNF